MKIEDDKPRDMLITDSELQKIVNLTLSPKDSLKHIQEEIIPEMEQRRKRSKSLSGETILKKLLDTNPDKPGEIHELLVGEIFLNPHKFPQGPQVRPSVASEIADIIYYVSQPNCPESIKDPSDFLQLLGIDMELARQFCIAKYTTRLEFGDFPHYKKIENRTLQLLLQKT